MCVYILFYIQFSAFQSQSITIMTISAISFTIKWMKILKIILMPESISGITSITIFDAAFQNLCVHWIIMCIFSSFFCSVSSFSACVYANK